MTFPYGLTVTLIRRTVTGTDAYGNDVLTETTEAVTGAVFAPGGSSESVQGQDLLVTMPRVFLPAGTDVSSIDAVEVGGLRYEVDGAPSVWASPFTAWTPGVELLLRAVTG